jgi:hypothetical protein
MAIAKAKPFHKIKKKALADLPAHAKDLFFFLAGRLLRTVEPQLEGCLAKAGATAEAEVASAASAKAASMPPDTPAAAFPAGRTAGGSPSV